MTHEEKPRQEELRRRYRLEQPSAEQIVEETDPQLAHEARRLHELSRRFQLGLTWPECVNLAREARREDVTG